MGFYSKIRTLVSKKNQGYISQFLVYSGMKPKVNRKVISSLRRGIVVFSADFEMAWAFRYSRTKAREVVEMGLRERQNVPKILKLFDSYEIPITWATVGHLFLNSCIRDKNGLAHPKMKRPHFSENRNWIFTSGDWYQHDPCTDVKSNPAWYASDLIESILQSKTGHEIGCHTFSHIDFTDKNCSSELASSELDAFIKLTSAKGISCKSMVFPGGTAGNYKILKEKGFICYRKPMKYHLDIPYIDSYGLVAIPSSLGLDKDPYEWSKEFHLTMIKKFLKNAVKYKLVCHFWFHPSLHPWYLEKVLPDLIELVSDLKETGKVEVLTMGKLAEQILDNK